MATASTRVSQVRITHDPYAKGMAEKYGAPGKTDSEGFDPYADSVGPGIYGGTVERDARGQIVIGRQYQKHNPRPGPVYSGGGYTPTTQKLKDPEALRAWLAKHPDLVNEISTGGATPLHNCGMSARNQAQAAVLVENGADVEAVDTYGYTPLHRMASNNLAIGAELLLAAGADPQFVGGSGETAYAVARSSRARDVLKVLDAHGSKRSPVDVTRIVVEGGGDASVNGERVRRVDGAPMNRGDAAAATWIFCGDESWRRRGRDVDHPRRRVAAARPQRGWIVRRNLSTAASARRTLGIST